MVDLRQNSWEPKDENENGQFHWHRHTRHLHWHRRGLLRHSMQPLIPGRGKMKKNINDMFTEYIF